MFRLSSFTVVCGLIAPGLFAQDESPTQKDDMFSGESVEGAETYQIPEGGAAASSASDSEQSAPVKKPKKKSAPKKVEEAKEEPESKSSQVEAAAQPRPAADIAGSKETVVVPPRPGSTISDGSPITVAEKGLTLSAPTGWEVSRENPGLTIEFLAPSVSGETYRRNIQVRSFTPGTALTKTFAEEVAKKLTEAYSKVGGVVDYRMRDHSAVDLADGRKALLFYSDLTLNGVSLMQAHVVTSSAERHFIATYTDITANIEQKEGASVSPQWTEAWGSLMSLKLSSPMPQETNLFPTIGIIVGALVAFFGLISLVRRMRASRLYNSYGDDLGSDGLGDDEIKSDFSTTKDEFSTDPDKSAMKIATKVKSKYDEDDEF